jgi:hypothetical protein
MESVCTLPSRSWTKGCLVRGNLIHDTHSNRFATQGSYGNHSFGQDPPCAGIYLDGYSSGGLAPVLSVVGCRVLGEHRSTPTLSCGFVEVSIPEGTNFVVAVDYGPEKAAATAPDYKLAGTAAEGETGATTIPVGSG